jgi:hypothetical protein
LTTITTTKFEASNNISFLIKHLLYIMHAMMCENGTKKREIKNLMTKKNRKNLQTNNPVFCCCRVLIDYWTHTHLDNYSRTILCWIVQYSIIELQQILICDITIFQTKIKQLICFMHTFMSCALVLQPWPFFLKHTLLKIKVNTANYFFISLFFLKLLYFCGLHTQPYHELALLECHWLYPYHSAGNLFTNNTHKNTLTNRFIKFIELSIHFYYKSFSFKIYSRNALKIS